MDYTQHSVAFPKLPLDQRWYTDEVTVQPGNGDGGIRFTFMQFSGGNRGVQMAVFGDALHTLHDPRMARVIGDWMDMDTPDALTPAGLIESLERVGIEPSQYQRGGLVAAAGPDASGVCPDCGGGSGNHYTWCESWLGRRR